MSDDSNLNWFSIEHGSASFFFFFSYCAFPFLTQIFQQPCNRFHPCSVLSSNSYYNNGMFMIPACIWSDRMFDYGVWCVNAFFGSSGNLNSFFFAGISDCQNIKSLPPVQSESQLSQLFPSSSCLNPASPFIDVSFTHFHLHLYIHGQALVMQQRTGWIPLWFLWFVPHCMPGKPCWKVLVWLKQRLVYQVARRTIGLPSVETRRPVVSGGNGSAGTGQIEKEKCTYQSIY